MFYEVRILDKNGQVKKVLSSKELSKHYWREFQEHTYAHTAPNKGKKIAKKPKDVPLQEHTLDPSLFDDLES
jgi:hypothetical protein